jgi:acetate kinase
MADSQSRANENDSAVSGRVLAVNGGSSSIKFALFAVGQNANAEPSRISSGEIERIGLPGTALVVAGGDGQTSQRRGIAAADHEQAAESLIDWLSQQIADERLVGVGHRIVHGGTKLAEHQIVTDALVAEMKRAIPLDPSHMPREIAFVEAFARRLPGVPQIACFDTAFHRDLPTVAKLLPIPRRFFDAGVRRYGFHGLSYTYLLGELTRIAPREASGRVVFGHLGSGASLAAVNGGQPIDTSMAFTPTAGLVMGTRPGDLDPGLLVYLMREQNFPPEKLDEWLNRECGLLGVSASSSDVRDLLAASDGDPRAAEAIDLFCYQVTKWIGAYAAALGGLDALVFSAGIGEHSAEIRRRICEGMDFLGIKLDDKRNAAASGKSGAISSHDSPVVVRVIPTDEEIVIARTVLKLVGR